MTEEEVQGTVNIGCCCSWLLINMTFGAWCFDYALYHIFGKNVPWFIDVICGFLLGQFTIILALVCWILRLCGIETPLVN